MECAGVHLELSLFVRHLHFVVELRAGACRNIIDSHFPAIPHETILRYWREGRALQFASAVSS
uniref:Uncharacterized protein n=1 Tax=Arundo donax TaxID=35708 RepID=A0A0A9AK51_ARUDO